MNIKEIYNKIDKIIKSEDKEPMQTLEGIKRELEAELLTNGKINSGIKTTYNKIQKQLEGRDAFKCINKTKSGGYGITNTFYLLEYKSLESIPTQLQPYTRDSQNFTLSYDNLKNQIADTCYEIKISDLKKLINYKKIQKDYRPEYIISDQQNTIKLWLDAQYLMDIITLANYKKDSIIIEYASTNCKNPANIEFENANAILLPVNPTHNTDQHQMHIDLFNKILGIQ